VSGAPFVVLLMLVGGSSTDVACLVEGIVLRVVACLVVAASSTLGVDFDLLVVFGLHFLNLTHDLLIFEYLCAFFFQTAKKELPRQMKRRCVASHHNPA
jgi:hypothetical protein